MRRFVDSSKVVSCLDKVIVEKAVEDGVGAGGGDAQHVAEEEGDHHHLYNEDIRHYFLLDDIFLFL